MKLVAQLVETADVTPRQRDEMFALMRDHYVNVRRAVFEADLNEKRWVIVVRAPGSDELRGFSTQTLLAAQVGSRPIKALFSGDTIIQRAYWGDRALSRAWGRFALDLIAAHPGAELYWFLISQGYKTYRFLPLFFHEFHPRHDGVTPEQVKTIIDGLARQRHAETYDAAHGVLRATPEQYRLRPGLADVTPERLRDPHVGFFHVCNPGHAAGDELCCLAPLTRANFTPAAYRVIGAAALAVS